MASLHSLFVDEAAAAAAASISSSSSAELNFSRLLQDVESSVSDIDDIDIDIDGDQYTESQKMALSFTQRIAGLISLASGLYIFWKAWKRRDHVFHRLMLGLSTQTMLWGVLHIWGNAAVPAGTPDTYGAYGTTASCTAQGFLFQTTMVAPLYYVFLSCYSFAVIMHGNFDPAKYQWIEKYIHVGVHIFPIASAIYLLTIQAFNSTGLHCWIASIPFGCGDESGIECTRGPQNINTIIWIFGGIPAVFFVLFPTIVMIVLSCCVHRRQREGIVPCVITSSMVTKQSAVYLGSLYWIYLPQFLYYGMSNGTSKTKSYWMALLVSTISVSFGLWIAIVYWYFSGGDLSSSADNNTGGGGGGGGGGGVGNKIGGNFHINGNNSNSNSNSNSKKQQNQERETISVSQMSGFSNNTNNSNSNSNSNSGGCCGSNGATDIENPGVQQDAAAAAAAASISKSEQQQDGGGGNNNNNNNNSGSSSSISEMFRSQNSSSININNNKDSRGISRRSSDSLGLSRASAGGVNDNSRRASINIFDGTGASGHYSDFIFDGDSDDEENDLAESKHWAGCQ